MDIPFRSSKYEVCAKMGQETLHAPSSVQCPEKIQLCILTQPSQNRISRLFVSNSTSNALFND